MPVILPPGRARLSTRPASTGSAPLPVMMIGVVRGRLLGRADLRVSPRYNNEVDIETDEVGHKIR